MRYFFIVRGVRVNKMMKSKGYLYGFIGVVCFSLTLPATRIAVIDIDPTVVGLGRALVAAMLAAAVLYFHREKIPARRFWGHIALVAVGGVVGFPVFTSIAMTHADASHGAVVLGILPLATALFAVFFGRERPSIAFWIASVVGSCVVVGFMLAQTRGELVAYDLFLIVAVLSAGLAYAVGAQLAREIGSWQVICWALLISVPFLLPAVGWRIYQVGFTPKIPSLLGFVYVSAISMFFAFFAWYKGLAEGGTAKVGMLQLLQPFMTIGFSALLLGELITCTTILVAALVSGVVLVALKSRVKQMSSIIEKPALAHE